ncbi:MAG: restriction endonuclease subunit S [Betaproteobacteria bacterium]|nr:restriction endonuclease subunit S [Betaproteobacteria bacterium]
MSFKSASFGSLFSSPQKNGLTRPKSVRGSGIPMVNMGELFAHSRIHNISMDLVPVGDGEAHFLLQSEDLLFARQSLVLAGAGQCSIFVGNQLPTVFESHIIRCRLNKTISNPYFYFYFFRSPSGRTAIETIAEQGAGASGIRGSDLVKLSVPCPPKAYQDSVAEVLTSLDDRITLLRETNSTLEAIAQALFKSWFVDFDPVRAKQEGREPEGMDADTASLFPDSFEESELGLVPKGWRGKSLDTIAEYLNGLALQKFPPDEDDWLPVIKIAQLRKGDTNGADRANRRLKSEYIIQNGDVLFSWSGSLEVVVWCGGEGALNQHLFKVTSKDYPKWFYYFWTKHHLVSFQQTAASKATTMGHIQRKHLTEAKVVAPPIEIIQAISVYFAPLLERWITNELKAQTLATLRDTLLPRLISGQLRLPDAETTDDEVLIQLVKDRQEEHSVKVSLDEL